MDTQRLILFVIFSFSALFLWERWQSEHRPPAPPPAVQPALPVTAVDAPVPAGAMPPPTLPGAVPGVVAATSAPSEKVVIKTDLYTATVDTLGAVLTEIALSAHHDTNDESKPYVLLQKNAERTFVAQTGLLGEGFPNHRTPWQALPGPRELASGVNELVLTLQASAANGDKVEQKLTFHRGSYVIDVAYDVTNAGTAPIAPYAYFQLTRDTNAAVVQSSMAPAAYTGPVLYNETDKFKKLEFAELDKIATDPSRKLPYTKNADSGWVGMVEHYFVAAWLPPDDRKLPREFYARKLDGGLYSVGVIVPVGTVAPGSSASVSVPLYVGPQEQDVLGKLAKGLDLVVDYGIFTVIAAPLFWLLKW